MRVRGSSCSRQRCKYPPRVAGLCKKHAVEECDRLFSLQVRSVGVCELRGATPCAGNLQCCHLFTRSYKAIRWDSRNAAAGCQAHHVFYTHHPIEWMAWMVENRDADTLRDLRELALTHRTPDLELVLAELKEAA